MSPAKLEITQRLDNYRMPPEWAAHQATYMVWPHNLETWPGKFDPVPAAFAAVVATLSRFESVRLLMKDSGCTSSARQLLTAAQARMGQVAMLDLATNDSWIRDYGPIFVNRTETTGNSPAQLALDWRFNSWGRKYGPYDLDDVIPQRLGERYGFNSVDLPIVLEGGSVDVNGCGSVLTTESCLLNPNRNPDLNQGEIEDWLCACLGIKKVLWLGDGIAGDDTDGHVDDLARFVAPDTIVTVVEENSADENYRPLQDNLKRLRSMRDQDDQQFRIVTLPMPPALYHEGQRLPASYANFYIANGVVLVPTFGSPTDEQALAILRKLFPHRALFGFPCTDLVWGLGTIHCLTQQHPMADGKFAKIS